MKTIKTGTEYYFGLPEGYQFVDENGNIINATKIVLKKKKKEYPKTYEECCNVLGVEGSWHVNSTEWEEYDKLTPYEKKLDYITSRLKQLLICRYAYWKLAGDWKPDWAMYSGPKHCIIYSDNQIKWQCKSFVTEAKVLAFPTDMMRDFFYENFKDLIEECKELI